MTQATAIEAVRTRFIDNVATPNSLVVVHDNGPIEDVSSPRARVTVTIDSETQITMGASPTFRAVGRMDVQFLCARERGDGELVNLAQETVSEFIAQSIASPSVRFTPPPSLFGSVEFEDAMAKRTVRVPFLHDYQA